MDDRKKQLLETALDIALELGIALLTRGRVAKRAGVSTGAVNLAWTDMPTLKAAVITVAVEREHLPLIAQALAEKHPSVQDIPEPLKINALLTLTSA